MAITIHNLLPPMMSKYESIIPYLFNDPIDPFLRATVSEILFDGVFINCTSTDMTVGEFRKLNKKKHIMKIKSVKTFTKHSTSIYA